jgi:MYXO-CTERM domain-containing protein
MKKLLITAAALIACVSAYAQGTVLFQNSAATLVTTNGGGSLPAGTAFLVALYYAPNGADPGNAGMNRISDLPHSGLVSPGRFLSGVETTPATTPPGGMAWFQVRAWESAYGGDFEAAVAAPAQNGRLAFVGTSNRFLIATGSPPGPPSPIVTTGGFQGFGVSPVPEPSAIALGLLGLGSLLMLRRRK